MVTSARNSRKGGNQTNTRNKVLNVRIADNVAGTDGLRVDRMITSVKQAESQTRIVIGDSFDIATNASADILRSYGFDDIFNTDDFGSMLVQYNLFRIKAIKFEIFDINPNAPVFNTWGIWHDNYESAVPAYTRPNIADLPDARVLSGGTGQTTLYWVAHGTAEEQFQADSSSGSTSQRFGGLKYFVQSVSPSVPKYTVQVHAIVDFRGRR